MHHAKNSGLSVVRNSLLAEATGDYLWLLDSDDALTHDALAQLKSIIDKHLPDAILCDYEIWRPENPGNNRK